MARICREAGATVRVNVKLRDMNVTVSVQDEREVEVLASGLPLQHGSQLAMDVTLRCALTACGRARPNAATVDGAVADAARGVTWWSWPLRQEGAGVRRLTTSWNVSLGHVPGRHLMSCDVLHFWLGGDDGPECSPFLVARHSLDLSRRHAAISQEWMVPHLIWPTFSGRGEA